MARLRVPFSWFLVLFGSVALAGDVPADRKPETAQPPAATPSAPACQCGGAGQCCGQSMAQEAPRAEPRPAGCGCGRAKANVEGK